MKLNEITDPLAAFGWDMVCKKHAAGEKVEIKKETILALDPARRTDQFNLAAKRHALIDTINEHNDRKSGNYFATFIMPSTSSYWVTATFEMTPERQEGWMMKKKGQGWLAWREV